MVEVARIRVNQNAVSRKEYAVKGAVLRYILFRRRLIPQGLMNLNANWSFLWELKI